MSVYQEAYHLPEFTYDYEKLKIEQRGPVYICSFNDADNLNAMSYAQMAEFNDFLIKVRMDKDCRVIVLTGEGRSFCAGFNLNDLALDPPEAEEKCQGLVVLLGEDGPRGGKELGADGALQQLHRAVVILLHGAELGGVAVPDVALELQPSGHAREHVAAPCGREHGRARRVDPGAGAPKRDDRARALQNDDRPGLHGEFARGGDAVDGDTLEVASQHPCGFHFVRGENRGRSAGKEPIVW